VPDGVEATEPEVVVPRRRPGAGLGAVLAIDFAADYASVSDWSGSPDVPMTVRTVGDGESRPRVTYAFTIAYEGDGPEVDRLPLDVTAAVGMRYLESTLTANRLERRGRTASFDHVAPGLLGYVLRNYVRVFNEVRSPATRQSLFLAWTGNSFTFAFVRIVVTLLIASMAGYALARLRFRGREADLPARALRPDGAAAGAVHLELPGAARRHLHDRRLHALDPLGATPAACSTA
jgi:multiple sugar transport system permease protein